MAIPKPEIYNRIFGWFNFSEMYDTIFASLPKTFTFVEIGVFMGRSISYIAELKVLNNKFHHETANKNGLIIGIDHFQGSDEEVHREILKNMSLADKYYQNIAENGLSDHIVTLPYDSLTAVNYFADNSIDALFVDGSHDEDAVFKDNNTWLPKVRVGGIIAGHDWSNNFPGVKKAVIRTFGEGNFNIMPQAECWWKVVTEDDHVAAKNMIKAIEKLDETFSVFLGTGTNTPREYNPPFTSAPSGEVIHRVPLPGDNNPIVGNEASPNPVIANESAPNLPDSFRPHTGSLTGKIGAAGLMYEGTVQNFGYGESEFVKSETNADFEARMTRERVEFQQAFNQHIAKHPIPTSADHVDETEISVKRVQAVTGIKARQLPNGEW